MSHIHGVAFLVRVLTRARAVLAVIGTLISSSGSLSWCSSFQAIASLAQSSDGGHADCPGGEEDRGAVCGDEGAALLLRVREEDQEGAVTSERCLDLKLVCALRTKHCASSENQANRVRGVLLLGRVFAGIHSVQVDYHQQKVTVWGICNRDDVLAAVRKKRRDARFWNGDELGPGEHVPPPGEAPKQYLAAFTAYRLRKSWKKLFPLIRL